MSKSLFKTQSGKNYLFPFILITSLFFLWGFAHSLLDILNKHFQNALDLSKAQSGLVQASAYGAYFIMALPAGYIARKFGYKKGVLFGLLLFAIGCFWFVPAVGIDKFWAFLLGLLIIFSGLTFLETVANPYTTVLGDPKYAASRINLAQTFNALGWIAGPLVGSLFIFKNTSTDSPLVSFGKTLKVIFTGVAETSAQVATEGGKVVDNSALIIPYVSLGVVVVLVALMFFLAKLPEVNPDAETHSVDRTEGKSKAIHIPLFKQRRFVMAVVAQFLYVAAQTGIGSFFVNYTVETKNLGIGEMQAGFLLGLGGMGLFATGRFLGSFLMRYVKPEALLGSFALINTFLMLVTANRHDHLGIIALILSYLFMSIMFPSIFALGIKGLGPQTKTASSVMVMTVVGGAICPSLMGLIGEHNMNVGFIIPMICFAYIAVFGFVQSKQSIKMK
ncbi:MAG: fucP [Bacteroidetes bacterium]|nr:fucP [Bacteroidota bacterium]